MATTPTVSVVVPVLDGARELPGLLDALAGQDSAPPFEVIVVDNGSVDGTVQAVLAHPLSPRVVEERRRGSYAARDAGAVAAQGRVLAFTDADCRPRPRWLVEGVAGVDAGADLVAGAIEITTTDRPSRWERYDQAVYLHQEDFVAQGFGATANLFVRADVFAALAGFDARLRSGGDVDLGRRAVAAGYRLALARAATVSHPARRDLVGTWALHRRLGAGWAQLARGGGRPSPWSDRALWLDPRWVASRTAQAGERVRVRQLLPVHAVAMLARWTGRLTGR